LQHIKTPRPGNARVRRRRRIGADAAFARAMARAEFGRFYTDEREQREVRRSLEGAKARTAPDNRSSADRAGTAGEAEPPRPDGKPGAKPKLWHRPGIRERRTELAEAKARLAAAAVLRRERERERGAEE
jgi:hypothetical protein